MLLVSIGEFAQLTAGIARGNLQLQVHSAALQAVAAALDTHHAEGRPIHESVAAVVFDARKLERATNAAIERIEKTLAFLKLLAEHSQTVHMIDIAGEAAALYETHAFLVAQRDARWERKG